MELDDLSARADRLTVFKTLATYTLKCLKEISTAEIGYQRRKNFGCG
jgi:hypothetical protein